MTRPIPWEYLADCSPISLQNFALSQLNVASELKRTIRADQERLMEVMINVELAELLIEKRDELARTASLRQGVLKFEAPKAESPHEFNREMRRRA